MRGENGTESLVVCLSNLMQVFSYFGFHISLR